MDYGTIGAGQKRALEREGEQRRTLLAVRALTCVSAAAEGYDLGMVSGVLVLIRESLGLGTAGASAFVGAFGFACALGALLGGRVADGLGRRLGLAATYALLVLGSMLLASSTGVVAAVAGRVLHGAGVGAGFVCVSLYLSELSPAHSRGVMVGLEALFLNVGMLAGAGGNYLVLGSTGSDDSDWRLMVLLSAVLPLACSVALVACGYLPESPRWLLLQGRTCEAVEVLRRICDDAEVERARAAWSLAGVSPAAGWREVLGPTAPRKRRALVSGVGVASLQMLSGLTVITYYSSHILSAEMGRREAFAGSLAMILVKLAMLVVPLVLVDRVGRRPLLLASSGLMSGAMGLLGWCYLVRAAAWLKVLSLCACTGSYSLGLGCVVYVYVSEVFGSRERAKGSALAFFVSRVMNGLVTTAFPFVEASLGMAGAWFGFAGLLLVGVGFVTAFVEETGCQSLEDIDAPEAPAPA